MEFSPHGPSCMTPGDLAKCHLSLKCQISISKRWEAGQRRLWWSCSWLMHLAHMLGTNLVIRFELRINFSLTWQHFEGKKGRGRHSASSARWNVFQFVKWTWVFGEQELLKWTEHSAWNSINLKFVRWGMVFNICEWKRERWMDLSGLHIYGIDVGGRKECEEFICSIPWFHCHKAGSNLPVSFLINIQIMQRPSGMELYNLPRHLFQCSTFLSLGQFSIASN